MGIYRAGSTSKNLLMHWNGRAWKQMVGPDPGSSSGLSSVSATSATNVWAVGTYNNSGSADVFASEQVVVA